MALAVDLVEPIESARAAGLRYVSDLSPGIRRKRAGKGFMYRNSEGRTVDDRDTIRRIKGLAVPPAWTVTKAKQAGAVGYHLLARVGAGTNGGQAVG